MTAETLERATTDSRPARTPFYASRMEESRTLRMERGGVCQLCARPTKQRVELHSPLWHAGPILYGECCLPQAEEALYVAKFGPRVAVAAPARPQRGFWGLWQTLSAAVILGAAAASLKWLF